MNLRRFFQVTSLFLVLFTVQLFIYAFHEFTEAGAVPGIDNEFWHLATEPYGPEGVYGEWLTYLMVLVPGRVARARRGGRIATLRPRVPRGPRETRLSPSSAPCTFASAMP